MIQVAGLVLVIDGQRHELSLDDARKLRDELCGALGARQEVGIAPWSPWPWTPPVESQPMQTIPTDRTVPYEIHWTRAESVTAQ